MKYIENKRLMEFLQRGHGDFGWTDAFLLNQIASVCSVLGGGPENPKITTEARTLFLEMFRDSDKPYPNLWGYKDFLQIISRQRKLGDSPDKIFRFIFDVCRGVDGKLFGSNASAPWA